MTSVVGFEPITASDARVLVLGTLPGVESLRQHEYYAQPQNAFWDAMGEQFGAFRSVRYAERTAILKRARVAIWDVLRSAVREGSTDKAIVKGTEVANDFNDFLPGHPSIVMIFFNGQPAEKFFRKLVLPTLSPRFAAIARQTLSSTSPLNTHLTKPAKLAEWRIIAHQVAASAP